MNYNTGYYTPPQMVQAIWTHLVNQVLQRSGVPNNIFPEVQNCLDTFALPLAIDFVGYEFEGRQIVEENARNVIAAVIEYSIAMVMSRYQLGCPQFQEGIKYVSSRIDVVMQRKNMNMQPGNNGIPVYNQNVQPPNNNMRPKYSQNTAVQPQYQSPFPTTVQEYQQPAREPLSTSELVAAINAENQRKPNKGEEMDISKHLHNVKPDNYNFKVCSDRQLASMTIKPSETKPPVTEPVTQAVGSSTNAIDAFLQVRVANEQDRVVVQPGYEFEFQVSENDTFSSTRAVTMEDSLANLQTAQLPTLERFIDIKTIAVKVKVEERELLMNRLIALRGLNSMFEYHAALTQINNEFSVSGLISWISNNITQYVLMALSDRYGLEESGFPFITNYGACVEYLEGGNSLNENILDPMSNLIVGRFHQLLDYVELTVLEQEKTEKNKDEVFRFLEFDIVKPRLMIPWHLTYRKSDQSVGITIDKQRVTINHLIAQSFGKLGDSVLYLDIMDIGANEYRAFRGSNAQFAPKNYRIQPNYI